MSYKIYLEEKKSNLFYINIPQIISAMKSKI